MSETIEQLAALLTEAGLKFTFSINCRSGLLKRCECWRCRKGRGEAVTEESERLAAEEAVAADADFGLQQRAWFASQRRPP